MYIYLYIYTCTFIQVVVSPLNSEERREIFKELLTKCNSKKIPSNLKVVVCLCV